jgi:hypothetical protein
VSSHDGNKLSTTCFLHRKFLPGSFRFAACPALDGAGAIVRSRTRTANEKLHQLAKLTKEARQASKRIVGACAPLFAFTFSGN